MGLKEARECYLNQHDSEMVTDVINDINDVVMKCAKKGYTSIQYPMFHYGTPLIERNRVLIMNILFDQGFTVSKTPNGDFIYVSGWSYFNYGKVGIK